MVRSQRLTTVPAAMASAPVGKIKARFPCLLASAAAPLARRTPAGRPPAALSEQGESVLDAGGAVWRAPCAHESYGRDRLSPAKATGDAVKVQDGDGCLETGSSWRHSP
jgi:hypothetical protein